MRKLHSLCVNLIALLLAAAIITTAGCSRNAPVHSGKPSAPLTLSLEPAGEITRGAVGEFTVIATALAASEDLSLDVSLPKDLALFSGDLHQRGAVAANTRFRLTFAVRVPATGDHTITATARMRVGSAGAFEANAVYVIGQDARAAPMPDSGATTTRQGEALREYRVK